MLRASEQSIKNTRIYKQIKQEICNIVASKAVQPTFYFNLRCLPLHTSATSHDKFSIPEIAPQFRPPSIHDTCSEHGTINTKQHIIPVPCNAMMSIRRMPARTLNYYARPTTLLSLAITIIDVMSPIGGLNRNIGC